MIEIDLLRGGERPPLAGPVPSAPYYVTLSRAPRRPVVDVWPIQLWEKLPAMPVPLLDPDPDVPLDLGTVVAAVYERGAYARLIDYRLPLLPHFQRQKLPGWINACVPSRRVETPAQVVTVSLWGCIVATHAGDYREGCVPACRRWQSLPCRRGPVQRQPRQRPTPCAPQPQAVVKPRACDVPSRRAQRLRGYR